MRVVLVWDKNCGPGTALNRGYGAALVTTDLTSTAEQIVERYAARWSIETAFRDARQTLGFGEARNRTRSAVERTVPVGLLAYTVVVAWYALTGHQPADTDRQAPPHRHRPQISQPTPPPGNTRRNPHRPHGPGQRRNTAPKTEKHEGFRHGYARDPHH